MAYGECNDAFLYVRSPFIRVQHGKSKALAVAPFATSQTAAEGDTDDDDEDDEEEYMRRISSCERALMPSNN